MSIMYKVGMTDIPNSCHDCSCQWCTLPLKANARGGLTDQLKKAYLTSRPKECPLREVKGEK